MVRRVPHHWVLVAETAWDRQASVGSPLVFEAICGMIGCLEDAIFRGRGVLRDMTVVSPRAMFSLVALAAVPMCHPSVIRCRKLMRHDGGNTLRSQDYREELRALPLNR